MAEESFQERTEKATPRKKREAREKGDVAKSMEINAAIVLIVSLAGLRLFGGSLLGGLSGLMRSVFEQLHTIEISLDSIQAMSLSSLRYLGIMMAPFVGMIMLAGLGSNLIQTGFMFTGEQLKPKMNKISPAKGFKRMFSMRSLVELAKSIFKLLIIGLVSYMSLRAELHNYPLLIHSDVGQIVAFISRVGFALALRAAVILLILAVFDYAYQRFEYEKKLRMTKQEIKDEYKRTEGDPLIKSRIRSIQREQARKRMLSEVPKADVVITNPIHLAVALKYDSKKSSAPVVVAKGARLVAEKIKKIAHENNVPVVENKPLARMLYKSVEVGGLIPYELFKAAAEILAYVYRLKKKKMQ
jgi:flagellar biosynthesis protein FlhB